MKNLALILSLFASIITSCSPPLPAGETDAHQHIRFNQVGYYPSAIKEFVVANHEAFSGQLINQGKWNASGETVLKGDFSKLAKAGSYSIQLNTGLTSTHFDIAAGVYGAALDASIKSFYFQRASMAIEEQYGEVYQRASGHPDDQCSYHPSSGLTEGTLSSPGGWYDAGDYGKYVVNAALTGFGSKQVMFPHHRPSGADAIDNPVPGFILGGPNMHKQDRQQVKYATDFPAKAFADVQDSYASNEVCLNWNAPAVFVLGYLEQIIK